MNDHLAVVTAVVLIVGFYFVRTHFLFLMRDCLNKVFQVHTWIIFMVKFTAKFSTCLLFIITLKYSLDLECEIDPQCFDPRCLCLFKLLYYSLGKTPVKLNVSTRLEFSLSRSTCSGILHSVPGTESNMDSK